MLNYWSNKKVAVTGADGFIGSHLVERLAREGATVRALVCNESRLRPEKSEVNRLLCDASLLNRLTGWKPSFTLQEGLQRTAEWIKKNPQAFRSNLYNL